MPSNVRSGLDPHVAVLHFEARQLTRAREMARMTRAALAEKIDKTPTAITQFENGQARPDPETLALLALALGVPLAFLTRKALVPDLSLEHCHFRFLRAVSQYERRQ